MLENYLEYSPLYYTNAQLLSHKCISYTQTLVSPYVHMDLPILKRIIYETGRAGSLTSPQALVKFTLYRVGVADA
jgi:hypothetical protein